MSMTAYESAQYVVRSLLANLMGNTSVSAQQGKNRVEPQDLDGFPYEREVLRLIYFLEANEVAPTLDAVKAAVSANGMEIAPLDDIARLALPERDVFGAAYSIKGIYQERKRNNELLTKITELLTGPRLPLDARTEALALLQRFVSESTQSASLHQVDLTEQFIENLNKAYHLSQTGGQLGPSWPFRQMVNLTPVMRRGELISFMGKSKYGKTMFGQIFAEHWSWTQEYDTHIYLFETSVELYWRRFIVRHCLIQGRDIDTGRWNLSDEEHPATIAFKEFVRTRVNGEISMLADGTIKAGSIYIHPCYGQNPFFLEAEITRAENQSKAEGREAVHLIDYLQKIDNSVHDKANPQNWNGVATWLKNFTQMNNLYMFCLVQEQEGSEIGVNDRIFPKGGNEILKQSQLVMRLERFIAKSSLPVGNGNNGIATDNSSHQGRERYWHQEGQFDSASQIQIIRANEDAGGVIDIRIENAFYRIREETVGTYHTSRL